jgi:Tol biopolymer transport system component
MTDTVSEKEVPSWSPDGTRISFIGKKDGGPWQIFLMRLWGPQQAKQEDRPGSAGARSLE